MIKGKAFFVDLTLCTACRGCQVACKQWKNLPAEKTRNVGSHQNPQDLSAKTLRLVRFNEVKEDGKLKWLFFPEQCRHCIEPPCKDIGNMYAAGAVKHDPVTGAVIMTEKTAGLTRLESWELCPYNIPRRDEETGIWNKCDMCINRVTKGMLPACVKSCPTGSMNFGDHDEMLALAKARLAEVQKTNPDAYLADPEHVRVIYLCESSPENYHDKLVASVAQRETMVATAPKAKSVTRRGMFKSVLGGSKNA